MKWKELYENIWVNNFESKKKREERKKIIKKETRTLNNKKN